MSDTGIAVAAAVVVGGFLSATGVLQGGQETEAGAAAPNRGSVPARAP